MLILGMLSCDVERCTSTKTNQLLAEFFRLGTNRTYPVKILSLQAVGNDSIFYERVLAQKLPLSLNPAADSTTFVMEYVPYRVDTIFLDPPRNEEFVLDTVDSAPRMESFAFSYNRSQRIISVDCGVEQTFSDLALESATISEIEVVNDTIDIFIGTNVRIFLPSN